MRKLFLGFSIRIGLLFIIGSGVIIPGWAQEEKEGDEEEESVKPRSGLEVSIDYLKLGTYVVDFETKFEATVGLLYKNKIRLAGEWGMGEIKPRRAIKNGQYISDGSYYRVGADWVASIDLKNNVYLGLRYGVSSFSDQGTATIESDLWDDFEGGFVRENLEADWFELVLGSENNIWNNLFLGWVFRFRVLNEYNSFEGFDVYTIPGYGRPINNTLPAVNLYVKYLIAL